MKTYRIFALLTVAAILLGLCGCALPPMVNTQGLPSAEMAEEPAPAVEVTAEPEEETATETEMVAPEVTTEPEAKSLDFDAAYAAYDPDTVVFYVEGTGVTWQELFYQIAFNAAYLASL